MKLTSNSRLNRCILTANLAACDSAALLLKSWGLDKASMLLAKDFTWKKIKQVTCIDHYRFTKLQQ